MFVAFENNGLQIEEILPKEIMAFSHSIKSQADALRVLSKAGKLRPDVKWLIVARGPWGVRGVL